MEIKKQKSRLISFFLVVIWVVFPVIPSWSRDDKGVEYYQRIIKQLAENNPDRLQAMINLAALYAQQEKWGLAQAQYKEALDIHEKIWGVGHPNTSDLHLALARIYGEQDHFEAGLKEIQIAYKIKKQAFSDNEIVLISLYEKQAWLYFRQGRFSKGEQSLKKALKIYREYYGELSSEQIPAIEILLFWLEQQGQWNGMLKEVEVLERIYLNHGGRNYEKIMELLRKKIELYRKMRKEDEALKVIEKIKRIEKETQS